MNVIDYMCDLAVKMAGDKRYGYSNKYPHNRFDDDTPYDGDCGAFVSHLLNKGLERIGIQETGYYEPQGNYYVWNEAYLLRYCDKYNYNSAAVKKGDILVNYGHTGIITSINPPYITHASQDLDGKSGDSSGREVLTQRLYQSNWKYIYRLKAKYNKNLDEEDDIMTKLETLKKGSKGTQVKNLQALLNLYISSERPIATDGVFGDYTEKRLKLYQAIRGLTADGICGYYTWDDLLLK